MRSTSRLALVLPNADGVCVALGARRLTVVEFEGIAEARDAPGLAQIAAMQFKLVAADHVTGLLEEADIQGLAVRPSAAIGIQVAR